MLIFNSNLQNKQSMRETKEESGLLTHCPDMKNSRCGMAGGQMVMHWPDMKNGRGGNPGRLTGKIELRGGMGGGCRREKTDVR